MKPQVHGLHHITAIAGDPQENLDFYTKILGLRLVKKSINQDAPDTYHLFFADKHGNPGTDLTFFPWPAMRKAQTGAGMATEVTFAIPKGSLGYWKDRLNSNNITFKEDTRFGDVHLVFEDPHGLQLTLTESDDDRDVEPWEKSSVPEKHQLRGMHSTRFQVKEMKFTEVLLCDGLGFEKGATENGWTRFTVDGGTSGNMVEVKADSSLGYGEWGTGGIHHIAWRVKDTQEEMEVRSRVMQFGLSPSPQIDRFWFKSVYFKEPGGVLFELATDGPGFDRDEDPESLGEKLILPPWYEDKRSVIEAGLPKLNYQP
ncbi:MAG: ring-cleaving dioxygenase [Balneolales bacterium]|nr:ring-cleaving dioxygenase [Balneolales bacterium]